MSIQLEHPTAVEMPENPAPALLATPIVHPETNELLAYDVTAHYAAHHTSVQLSATYRLTLGYENDQLDEDPGAPKRIIFHWSAGSYTMGWNGYQYGAGYDVHTGKAIALKFLKSTQK